MKNELKIIRIGNEKEINTLTNRLTFEYQDKEYTITPDFDGFRIHKHNLESEGLFIHPGCSNEIIVR